MAPKGNHISGFLFPPFYLFILTMFRLTGFVTTLGAESGGNASIHVPPPARSPWLELSDIIFTWKD